MLKLRFLTEDPRWIELASRFWQFDPDAGKFSIPADQIAQEMGTYANMAGQILAEYCITYDDVECCSKCGGPTHFFLSRTEYLRFSGRSQHNSPNETAICPDCRSKMEEERKAKEAQKNQLDDAAKIKIFQRFKDQRPVVEMATLSLEQAVFLDAYGRVGLTENLDMLLSLDTVQSLKRKLTPSEDSDYELVQSLCKTGLIRMHPENKPDIITDVQSEDDWSYFPAYTNWYFPVSPLNPHAPASLFHELEQVFINKTWPDCWQEQALPLWQKVALWDCLEYLDHVLAEHKLPYKPGEKTIHTFQSLLARFSTAQIYGFIWKAGRDAAAFYVREGVTKQHAANTVIGTVQRMAERAEAEGWEVKGFHRNFDCPQSVLSQVLYNAVLKIGDKGFSSVPA